MPYSQQHKAQTRARIVESARVMFNRHGFEQVSIDKIMEEAGLTRGGFYNHFGSKDELYAEAVHSFTTCNPFARKQALATDRAPPEKLARMLVELYLSDAILDDVDQHCPLVALPSDVARAGLAPRAAYTQLVQNMLQVFQGAIPAGDRRRKEKAQLIVNLCVGGMVIARTTEDSTLARAMRSAARKQALTLLEGRSREGPGARTKRAGKRRGA